MVAKKNIPSARQPRAMLPFKRLKKHKKQVLIIKGNIYPYVFTCAEHVEIVH
jgi:hypothetical protein